MKEKIHPKYYPNATVQCACGNKFTMGSTKEFTEVEVCSQCHPFYTGKKKILDTLGQVQKFQRRLERKSSFAKATEDKKKKKND